MILSPLAQWKVHWFLRALDHSSSSSFPPPATYLGVHMSRPIPQAQDYDEGEIKRQWRVTTPSEFRTPLPRFQWGGNQTDWKEWTSTLESLAVGWRAHKELMEPREPFELVSPSLPLPKCCSTTREFYDTSTDLWQHILVRRCVAPSIVQVHTDLLFHLAFVETIAMWMYVLPSLRLEGDVASPIYCQLVFSEDEQPLTDTQMAWIGISLGWARQRKHHMDTCCHSRRCGHLSTQTLPVSFVGEWVRHLQTWLHLSRRWQTFSHAFGRPVWDQFYHPSMTQETVDKARTQWIEIIWTSRVAS